MYIYNQSQIFTPYKKKRNPFYYLNYDRTPNIKNGSSNLQINQEEQKGSSFFGEKLGKTPKIGRN